MHSLGWVLKASRLVTAVLYYLGNVSLMCFLPPFFDNAACIFLRGCGLHGSDRFVDGAAGGVETKTPNGNGSLYSILLTL